MKIAVIGSRGIQINIAPYIPSNMTVLVSGGAVGIDTLAEHYADTHHIPKIILQPEYQKYGRRAPLIRNEEMVKIADQVIAIWDGISRGTKFTIDYARKTGKPVKVYLIAKTGPGQNNYPKNT